MTTTLHNLKNSPGSRKREKRVGRGNASGHGTYSTRGVKGQRARSGGRSGQQRRGMKRIVLATPKLGGFNSGKPRNRITSVGALEKFFKAGEKVTAQILEEKGLVARRAGKVKVLDTGSITKALELTGLLVSAGARAKIEAVGGKIL